MKTDRIHLGEIIKEQLELVGMNNAELGRRINTSRQNIDKILKKNSIDSEQLYKIGQAMNYDFFNHYRDDKKQPVVDEPKKARILIELELDNDEILKLGIKDKVLQILNQ